MLKQTILAVITAAVLGVPAMAEDGKQACDLNKLVVIAKLSEIPGTGEFTEYPKNSVYYYHIDVLRYEVVKVLQGAYDGDVIMVGQYIPLVPREKIKDKMDEYVDGDLTEFKAGDVHRLVLGTPITKYYDREDAIFDDYFDDEEGDRYFALRTDLVESAE